MHTILVILALLSWAQHVAASEEPRHLANAQVHSSPATPSSNEANKYAREWDDRVTLYQIYANGYDTRKKLYQKAEEIKKLGDTLTPDIKKLEERISELDNQPKPQ